MKQQFKELIGDRTKVLAFYGHSNKKDEVTKACFSQFYPASFTTNEATFHCAEQYMMYNKAKIFGDVVIMEKVLLCSSPAQAKKLGRQVRNFKPELWDDNKFKVVCKGNYHKFSQNPELKKFLLAKEDFILVEAAKYDKIWGVGLDITDPSVNNVAKWKGENLLGFALMDTLKKLKNEL